jgi:hypothetical protein
MASRLKQEAEKIFVEKALQNSIDGLILITR